VGGSEYHCVVQNCRDNLLESVGYALRSATARRFRLFFDNTTIVIALNEFARSRLVDAGFRPQQVVVLPNTVDIPDASTDAAGGSNVVFSGRMCHEKGVDTLLAAARIATDVPVRLVGDGPIRADLESAAPPNAVFAGQLSGTGVAEEYRRARFLVVPSRWFEGCPLVIPEAMSHGLPVVASRIGGLPELVDDGVTGLLFEPGDANDLAIKMRSLWDDPSRCREMGQAGRRKALEEHSEAVYWDRLKSIYLAAAEANGVDPRGRVPEGARWP
jgi:glycosyltransferase involved in cell wall biosynthesis